MITIGFAFMFAWALGLLIRTGITGERLTPKEMTVSCIVAFILGAVLRRVGVL